eukprot:PhF_6_TR6955/c1_g1_i8/m.10255
MVHAPVHETSTRKKKRKSTRRRIQRVHSTLQTNTGTATWYNRLDRLGISFRSLRSLCCSSRCIRYHCVPELGSIASLGFISELVCWIAVYGGCWCHDVGCLCMQ